MTSFRDKLVVLLEQQLSSRIPAMADREVVFDSVLALVGEHWHAYADELAEVVDNTHMRKPVGKYVVGEQENAGRFEPVWGDICQFAHILADEFIDGAAEPRSSAGIVRRQIKNVN